MELKKGDILHGRYRIEAKLGQGGMGVVYLAHDLSLDQKVAVKVNRDPSEQAARQFLKEAQILASLRHPNLPRVTDYFVDGMDQILVMDFIAGEDLSSMIKKEGAQSLDKVMKWGEQLGSALSYMHSRKPPVIHRDIKPGNIKLTPAGEIILVDFGVAKAGELTQATATGATSYTPGFAPPEQMSGARTGPYSDQYAMAATIFYLLSGRQPEDGVQRGLGKEDLTPIRKYNRKLPLQVEYSLTRALSLRPEERFKDINDFIQALKDPDFRPVKGPILPVQPGVPKKTSRVKIWAWALILATCGFVVGLGGIGVYRFFPEILFGLSMTSTPTVDMGAILATRVEAASIATTTQSALLEGQTVTALMPTVTLTPDKYILGGGGEIAFASDRSDGITLQIWTMPVYMNNQSRIIVGNPRQITFSAGDKTQPVWSPDGKRFAFVAPGEGKNNLDIWVMDANGEGAIDLTNKPGDEFDPAWSPDGKFIAYTKPNKVGSPLLYFMQSDGKNVHLLGDTYQQSQPTWSSDMQWLVYVMSAQDHDYLFMRNIAHEYLTPVPFDLDSFFGRLGQVAHPVFSPDGQLIAYTRIDLKGNNICTVEFLTRGGDISQLTMTGSDDYPTWSIDNHWLAFQSSRDGNPEIYVMTSTGQLQTRLTDHPGRDLQPSWNIK